MYGEAPHIAICLAYKLLLVLSQEFSVYTLTGRDCLLLTFFVNRFVMHGINSRGKLPYIYMLNIHAKYTARSKWIENVSHSITC